jgi:protein ImuB
MQRLGFLGLRTLGQYAALPPGAVWQQFGRAGRLAQRCARGEDNRPVVPRAQVRCLTARYDLENPLSQQELLLQVLQDMLSPLLEELQGKLQACGRLRLTVCFFDGGVQEREHAFLFPTAKMARILAALQQLLVNMHWQSGATALEVALERIQDVVVQQLSLFSAQSERERKLREVQQYIAARFGANRLRRAVLAQPAAPLPEWRFNWLEET